MKVILLQDVKGQGKKGQLIEVSNGYATNFLFPKKLASDATAAALNEMKNREAAIRHKHDVEYAAAVEAKEKFKDVSVKVYAKGGSAGKLFGSVTAKEIAEALREQFSLDIDKRLILLDEPIRQFGIYELKVKLFPEVTASMKVELIQSK